MKKYQVTFEITSYYNVYVNADNEQAASEKALNEFDSADFGEGFNVGGKIISIREE